MHQRTKALSIPTAVKAAVADRDSHGGWPCCILCGRPAPERLAWSNAHYISRGQGGLGVEENILTLCPDCHRAYDTGKRQALRPILRAYLQDNYPGWDEENLIYRK